MRLSELIDGDRTDVPANLEICGLTADSREVRPGYLFAAISGTRRRGADFIAEALSQGAVAVLAEPDIDLSSLAVPCVRDANPRRRLALMAARFFPRQPRTIAAVTGTNGKSSIVAFVRQLWAAAGRQAASLGTLGVVGGGFEEPVTLTTPDPIALHRALDAMAGRGIDHLALEASSHGLDQFRLDGVRVKAAAFTNLSRDHLDYHPDAASYLKAKLRLFDTILADEGAAIVNADMPSPVRKAVEAVALRRGQRLVRYGVEGRDIRLLKTTPTPGGQKLEIEVLGARHVVPLPLVGDFQASNALAALALVIACGGTPAGTLEALARLKAVRGRVEPVKGHPAGAWIFVDYAHTPDALKTILRALRGHTLGRLVVVFGCGGDRDRGKRPEMGAIATELADMVFVTDDNPRTEDPAAIRREILGAAPGAVEIGDRAAAIAAAVTMVGAGDTLLIAGKGHEPGQIVGGDVKPFDDVEEVRRAMRGLGGGKA